MNKRYALRDDQWDRIKDHLPGRAGTVGVTARNNRLFVEAVLYRYRAGIPWRDLPERFGDFRVIHTRFSRWSQKAFGSGCLKSCVPMQTMNMRCLIPRLFAPTSTVLEKGGSSDWTQPGRTEHQDPCPGGCAG